MKPDAKNQTQIYDAFISYSRKDKEFASRLEKALEAYRPSKDLAKNLNHSAILISFAMKMKRISQGLNIGIL